MTEPAFAARPYQQAALDCVEGCYRRGVNSALLVLPTGCGKTQVFSWLIARRRAAGDLRPTLVVAHRDELLQQARDRIRQIVPDARVEIECGAQRASPGASVIVASVQTIGRNGSGRRLPWLSNAEGIKSDFSLSLSLSTYPPRGDGGCAGLIIIDEAHHAAAPQYQLMLEQFRTPKTQVLGVTATPKRLDRQALHGHERSVFEEVAYTYAIRDAIVDGWLADIRGYRVEGGADLSGVKLQIGGGDYAAGDLARRVDDPARTDAALRHWQEVAAERQTIVFCAGVEHAKHVAEAFRDRGIRAEAADGSLGREERAAIVERFRAGETQVLCNCELYTEGFDVPEAACALMLRPTTSWGLYVQMVGRVTRLAPGKSDAVVIDVVDNCSRHSLATVPAILDLPPSLDLEGQSLRRAAEAMEEMGERAAALQGVLPGSWSQLQTLLRQVDLFAQIDPAPEVNGRMAWLAVPGGYQISCGGNGRLARLTEDALGNWQLTLLHREQGDRSRIIDLRQQAGSALSAAVETAERVIGQWWPEADRLALKAAPWRGRPASEKQIGFLRRMNPDFPEEALAQLTTGQASAMIDRLLHAGRKPAVSSRR